MGSFGVVELIVVGPFARLYLFAGKVGVVGVSEGFACYFGVGLIFCTVTGVLLDDRIVSVLVLMLILGNCGRHYHRRISISRLVLILIGLGWQLLLLLSLLGLVGSQAINEPPESIAAVPDYTEYCEHSQPLGEAQKLKNRMGRGAIVLQVILEGFVRSEI